MEQSPEQSFLQQYLAERDETCPACGYNLRGLQHDQCPECGEGLVLRVGLEHPKMKLLITGLIGIACGLGLNGLLLVYLLIRLIGDRFRIDSFILPFMIHNGLGFVLEGALLTAWLLLWRRIMRRSVGVRFLLAMACWAATVINIIIFSIVID